jgi:hypothetical protein
VGTAVSAAVGTAVASGSAMSAEAEAVATGSLTWVEGLLQAAASARPEAMNSDKVIEMRIVSP